MNLQEFHYRVLRRIRRVRPGVHPGAHLGDGQETISHTGLLEGRDPRRIDLLASARDPMRRLLLRVSRQRASLPVYLLADLSASVTTPGRIHKHELLAEFTSALALSVYRNGDAFAFLGFDEAVRTDFMHPPGRARGVGIDVARRLRALDAAGRNADAMRQAASLVTRRDALVFLVSDFFVAPALVEDTLDRLARCQVVPVVLADSADAEPGPRFGIARLEDAESGRRRTVVVWPGMRERLRERHRQHFATLEHAFRRRGMAPLWLRDRLDVDHVTRHFHG